VAVKVPVPGLEAGMRVKRAARAAKAEVARAAKAEVARVAKAEAVKAITSKEGSKV